MSNSSAQIGTPTPKTCRHSGEALRSNPGRSPRNKQYRQRHLIGARALPGPSLRGLHHTQGVREGSIGFDYTSRRKSASCNMRSTVEHPEAVYRYLEDECSKGRVLGPFLPPQVHVSRLGVVPKKGIDKWRLILDLSSLEGRSGIWPELAPLVRIRGRPCQDGHTGRPRGSPGEGGALTS